MGFTLCICYYNSQGSLNPVIDIKNRIEPNHQIATKPATNFKVGSLDLVEELLQTELRRALAKVATI
jgi:hypothetical protein